MSEIIPASDVVQDRSKSDWCDLFGGERILHNAAAAIRSSVESQRSAQQPDIIILSDALTFAGTIEANDIRLMNTTEFNLLILQLNIPSLSLLTHVSDDHWMQWKDECLRRGTYSATVIPNACPDDEKTLLAHAFFCQNILPFFCRKDENFPPKGVRALRLKYGTSSTRLVERSDENK